MGTQITVKKLISSGDGIGWADGTTWFIPFSAPGDVVDVRLSHKRKRHRVVTDFKLVVPSFMRTESVCPLFGRCGGCDLQHISYEHHRKIKTEILRELFFQKQGSAPEMIDFVSPGRFGTRTRTKVLVRNGRPHFRKKRSHDTVAFSFCPLLHSGLNQILKTDAEYRSSGGYVQYEYGSENGKWIPREKFIVRTVGGRPFTVSSGAFFQPSESGAIALHDLIADYTVDGLFSRVLDLFAGGGLFSRAVEKHVSTIKAVESHGVSAADYRTNTGGRYQLFKRDAYVLKRAFFSEFDLIIADPPRRGLGTVLCREIAASSCSDVVLVSCDPAAFVRDALILADSGFFLSTVTIVDQFPFTVHFETVGIFRR